MKTSLVVSDKYRWATCYQIAKNGFIWIYTIGWEFEFFCTLYLRQIFPSGVVLQTISPDGVVFKYFPGGDSFIRKMHGVTSKPPLLMASSLRQGHVAGKPPPPLASSFQVELATSTGKSTSGFANHWFDWRLAVQFAG